MRSRTVQDTTQIEKDGSRPLEPYLKMVDNVALTPQLRTALPHLHGYRLAGCRANGMTAVRRSASDSFAVLCSAVPQRCCIGLPCQRCSAAALLQCSGSSSLFH
jgi:predicted metalloendopeptidase